MLTGETTTTGTPAYIAPEVLLSGDQVDGRADLYALGCVAYWLLTGRLVFEGKTAISLALMHASRPPTPPSQVAGVDSPAALDGLVLACLEKDPTRRLPSVTALAEQVAALQQQYPWSESDAQAWWSRHLPEDRAAGSILPSSGRSLG
jgi:serine/threonine-protein kinase